MVKDPKRVASGKKSKRKGSSFELKLSKQFEKWWGKGQFARSPGSGGWGRPQNRDGFNASGDIITTNRDFPWCLELKHQEGWTLDQLLLNDGCIIHSWWAQCVDETPDNIVPMLIFKKNRQPPMVMAHQLDRPERGFEDDSDLHIELLSNDVRMMYMKDQFGKRVIIFPLEDLFKRDPSLLGRKDE